MNEEKYKKFLETDFVVFDLETSGLDPVSDEVLEVAAVKMRGKERVDQYESLIRPTRPVPPDSERIHGLNELYLLVNGRDSKEAIADLMNFIGDTIVVGHNIREFDWLFILNHISREMGPTPDNKLIDTLELSKKLLPLPRFTLGHVASHFKIEQKEAHRAMPDVEVNAKIFVELMELLLNK